MSVTVDDLAAELHIDPQVIVNAAHELINSSDQKVLTVGPSESGDAEPVACLTDRAAAAIRTRLRARS